MKQKGYASLLIIGTLLVTFLIGSSIYYFVHKKGTDELVSDEVPTSLPSSLNKSQASPYQNNLFSPSPKNKPSIHLADDPNISIEKIKIMALLFVPKDVVSPLDDKWKDLSQDWNKDVITFWQNNLENKSTIIFETYPQVIRGEKNAGEYDYKSVYQELWPKISTDFQLSPYFNGQKNEFLTLFVYVLSDDQHFYKATPAATHLSTQGSTFGLFISSMDHKFELLDRSRGGFPGEEAHELGHALGLQHTTDDPNLVSKYLRDNVWTSACDLMLGAKVVGNEWKSYTQNKDWDRAKNLQDLDCIIPEQKKLFFTP